MNEVKRTNKTNETKKYELTDETITLATGKILHQIKALRDIYNECNNLIAKAGELGGFVEKEDNLSHSGSCWVFNNARVYGNAMVCGNAMVYDDAMAYGDATVFGTARVYKTARVCGNAIVYDDAWVCENARVCDDARVYGKARVCENARVYGNATICGNAMIYGNAVVYDDARVCGDAWVYGNAKVYGNAWVYGDARVCGTAWVYGNAKVCNNVHIKNYTKIIVPIEADKDYYTVGPIGSRGGYTTFQKSSEDNEIYVATGCFKGTLDEFVDAVRETHGDNEYAKEYFKAIDNAKAYFGIK